MGRIREDFEFGISEIEEATDFCRRLALKAEHALPSSLVQLQRQLSSEGFGASDAEGFDSKDGHYRRHRVSECVGVPNRLRINSMFISTAAKNAIHLRGHSSSQVTETDLHVKGGAKNAVNGRQRDGPLKSRYEILLVAETKYPLILFLHGAGERGNDNAAQLVHCPPYRTRRHEPG